MLTFVRNRPIALDAFRRAVARRPELGLDTVDHVLRLPTVHDIRDLSRRPTLEPPRRASLLLALTRRLGAALLALVFVNLELASSKVQNPAQEVTRHGALNLTSLDASVASLTNSTLSTSRKRITTGIEARGHDLPDRGGAGSARNARP